MAAFEHCDRCGNEIEELEDLNLIRIDTWHEIGMIVLCNECLVKFGKFMKEGETDNESRMV